MRFLKYTIFVHRFPYIDLLRYFWSIVRVKGNVIRTLLALYTSIPVRNDSLQQDIIQAGPMLDLRRILSEGMDGNMVMSFYHTKVKVSDVWV